MRGAAFHNRIVEEAKVIFSNHGWQIHTEYRYRNYGITTYFDLLAIRENHKIACEVETTPRHAIDNAIKALSVGISLWIIVPSRTLRRQVKQKLASSNLVANHQSIRVFLLCQLEAELADFSGK